MDITITEDEERTAEETCTAKDTYTVSQKGVVPETMQRQQDNGVDELQVGPSFLGKRKEALSEETDEIDEQTSEISVARPNAATIFYTQNKEKRHKKSTR